MELILIAAPALTVLLASAMMRAAYLWGREMGRLETRGRHAAPRGPAIPRTKQALAGWGCP